MTTTTPAAQTPNTSDTPDPMRTTAQSLTDGQIAAYRRDGFIHIPGIISREEAAGFRRAAIDLAAADQGLAAGAVFSQHVNVWREDPAMRRLTLHAGLAAVARALAGAPLRLWHDQVLIKRPHNQVPTEFHQDQPYWPHAGPSHPISAWIALGDVPVERGCMTFLPGSHRRTDLPVQNLADEHSLFEICPALCWSPRVTVPLRAGDCTFHHGRCAHMATPNHTDEARVAHVVIFMDAETAYSGGAHVVTDPLGLTPGEAFPDDVFPPANP